LYVLQNTKAVTLPPALPYQAELYKVYQEEAELLLLGKQDIDTTIAKTKDRLQKIVNSNK